MRTRLLYLIAGIVLASVVLIGAGLLHAQSTFAGPKWEYVWLNSGMEKIAELPVKGAQLNGQDLPFTGNLFQLFDAIGAQGYEYVEQNGDFYLFKRAATP